MGLYRALGKTLGVPVVVPVWFYKKSADCVDNRNAVGFRDDEFADMEIIPVGENYDAGLSVLDSHRGWSHLCCNSMWSPNFRRLQLEAVSRGEKTAVGMESPCNMFTGVKRLLKEIYYRTQLPWKMGEVIKRSHFFVNYSGNDDKNGILIGWEKEKIIPFGYFPPPIPETAVCRRITNSPFEILVTGEHTWHRGVDVVIKALARLKEMGVVYHATITQNGPLRKNCELFALKSNLPIDFVGRIPMKDLRSAYEKCSVFVGAGRAEPWGMRLNDALNCGAPLVVSKGMGGVKIVEDYGAGLSFENENPYDLADKLSMLAQDYELYVKCATNAVSAAKFCSSEYKAQELVQQIKERFPFWMI
jgi:glycosyltransferase involved in cell wall biosynthesis